MIIFLAFACSNSPRDDYRVSLLESLGNDIFVSTLAEFSSRSAAFSEQATSDCSVEGITGASGLVSLAEA